MNTEELLKKNKKVTNLLNEWWIERMTLSLEKANLPDDFKETVIKMDITGSQIARTIDNNPHVLFEFFDKNKIFIRTDFTDDYSFFGCSINDNLTYYKFKNRKDAERDIIDDAFELLEKSL